MADIPQAAITAAASAIERELMGGTSYGFAMASDEALARVALEAAAPILAEAWGVKPKRARGPRPAKRVACPRCGEGSGEDCRSANNWPTSPHKARAQAALRAGLFPLHPENGGHPGEQ